MKRRQSFLEDARLDRRLALIGALYLVLIASIVGYNAVAIGRERGAALIVNIAARQRATLVAGAAIARCRVRGGGPGRRHDSGIWRRRLYV